MPKITLKIMFGPLKSLIGLEELTFEVENFNEILKIMCEIYGKEIYDIFFTKNGKDHPFNYVIMDGKTYRVTEIMKIKFNEDKVIYLWPALDGG